MQAAAEQWCQERLLHAGLPWPLLRTFIPENQRQPLLAGLALVQGLREALLVSSEPEVALHKLAWWRQQMEQPARSTHPAFTALHASGLAQRWDWPATDAWCEQLAALIEPHAPADRQTLWQQSGQVAGSGLRLLIKALEPQQTRAAATTAMDIATAGWLVQQINHLGLEPRTHRWIPLSLRARHALQLDPDQPAAGNSDGLTACVHDLLAAALPVLGQRGGGLSASANSGLPRLMAMQQRLSLQLARRLQQYPERVWRQPLNTVTWLSAWHCRSALRLLD